jgi:hypothetical protein
VCVATGAGAAAGAEKSSSRPNKSSTGSGAFAGGAGVAGAVDERAGARAASPLVEREFDLRTVTSSSPASYSSNVLLVAESLKPPLPPE